MADQENSEVSTTPMEEKKDEPENASVDVSKTDKTLKEAPSTNEQKVKEEKDDKKEKQEDLSEVDSSVRVKFLDFLLYIPYIFF